VDPQFTCPDVHMDPHIMRHHVTSPHGGHMDEYTPAIVGKHYARPGIKVKKSLKDFLYFY
jgi:hypothetical protein